MRDSSKTSSIKHLQVRHFLNATLQIPCRFEGRLKKLRWWLEHMEKRMTTDLLEAKQRGPEKAVLEQAEEYQQEVLKERSVY